MRITGGTLKGKEVISKKKRHVHIRPTSGKVREALFNMLKHGRFLKEIDLISEDGRSIIEGRVIADIFCGTGILGFESFSRGADKVIFVDQSEESLKIARQNAEKFNLIEVSAFVRSSSINLPLALEKADIIFMDPPYGKNLVKPALFSIEDKDWINDGGIIVVEHSKKEDLKNWGNFKILDQRSYNNTVITIFQKI